MRAALACALGVLATAAAADAPLPEVATALDRIKSASTVELTTTGRRTGKEHKKPVWFVVQDGTIVVQAGKDGKTDWYRNLTKTPTAVVRQDGYSFRVRAAMVTDAQRVEAVHKLFTPSTRRRGCCPSWAPRSGRDGRSSWCRWRCR